jgi:broad specificity phosphatase PhoE
VAPEALADVYVRHAMALRDTDRPPREWELGPAGRAAARVLAAQLPRSVAPAVVVSSTEPKALATAAPIAERFGVEVVPDERLVEAHRPWVGSPDDYRAMAHRYLAGFATPGWEDAGAVVDRMAAGVRAARASVSGRPVAVVGHGLSLCLHLASVLPEGFDPSGLWARLSFPDAWTVDRADLVLSRCRPV